MRKLTFEGRLFRLALAAGLPGSAMGLALLWTGDYSPRTQWTFTLLTGMLWLGFASAVRARVIFQMQTLSNIVAALREGDFSVRARSARRGEGLTELVRELNALSDTLRRERLGAVEATTLLRKVMEEIEVAVFTFDGEQRLRLVNPAGERLLGRTADELLGRTADELELAPCLRAEPFKTLDVLFPGGKGRWAISRTTFREQGLPHQLLVLTDLSRALREEERQAWQRLIRVLGHELNNSLTPIRSIAASLEGLLSREQLEGDWKEDVQKGLHVISSRAQALSRFMAAYSRLARLPKPQPSLVHLSSSVHRVATLETRLKVAVREGPALTLQADSDQLEQLLINLVQNAVDAALEAGGAVEVGWRKNGHWAEIVVKDEGPGLPDSANLFVPFFTTKPNGSGIGLVLCRQIAEAHGGTLTLQNRPNTPGCEARLLLPLGSK